MKLDTEKLKESDLQSLYTKTCFTQLYFSPPSYCLLIMSTVLEQEFLAVLVKTWLPVLPIIQTKSLMMKLRILLLHSRLLIRMEELQVW